MTATISCSDELDLLRHRIESGDAAGPGEVGLDGLILAYQDLPSLYTAYKTIFSRRIYHFDVQSDRPFIIDGGAHIGLAALYFKRAYPAARVIAFEPDPEVIALLRCNLAANHASDVEVVEAALSEERRSAAFVSDGSDGGRLTTCASVEEPRPSGRAALPIPSGFFSRSDSSVSHDSVNTARTVPAVRLSEYITEPVDLLKLNVEGEEWPILRELESSGMLRFVRRVILEYHGWPPDHSDGSAGTRQCLGDILTLLDRNGYRYLLHDFDRETNPASKPPFRLRSSSPWFCLVYAERDSNAMHGPSTAVRSHPSAPGFAGGRSGSAVTHPSAKPGAEGPTIPSHREVRTPSSVADRLNWGDLRRVEPVSRVFGLDLGTPVDRYYIEQFLQRHRADIRGRVLEIGDATYTHRFGAPRVTKSDILHATGASRSATLVGDLASGVGIPEGAFDCIILTQTLHVIEDVRSALVNCARALVPGGALLLTAPGISQISRYDMERWGDYWRFTTLSLRQLVAGAFGMENVAVQAHGNVLAATAFLQGIPMERLTPAELDAHDPDYELLITVAAIRSAST